MTRLASGELLALACSGSARHALARYRQRWTIETMFGNLKTKGFALEATHLTDPKKLCTLLALLAFALALTVKTGVAAPGFSPASSERIFGAETSQSRVKVEESCSGVRSDRMGCLQPDPRRTSPAAKKTEKNRCFSMRRV